MVVGRYLEISLSAGMVVGNCVASLGRTKNSRYIPFRIVETWQEDYEETNESIATET